MQPDMEQRLTNLKSEKQINYILNMVPLRPLSDK